MSDILVVDWGSTNIRLLYKKSSELVVHAFPLSLLEINGAFYSTFQKVMQDVPNLPVLMCGMVGSAQGWRETSYVENLSTIAHSLVDIADLTHRPCWIIPGYRCQHSFVDVMRGEETQLLGSYSQSKFFVFPGTHSKWVWKEKESYFFRTYMTGELFALLQKEGLISKVLTAGEFSSEVFLQGVKQSQCEGGVLHQLFSVRAKGVQKELPSNQLRSFLSGVMIGTELSYVQPKDSVCIVGSDTVSSYYQLALSDLFPDVSIEKISGEEAVYRGACKIWEQRHA